MIAAVFLAAIGSVTTPTAVAVAENPDYLYRTQKVIKKKPLFLQTI